MNATITDEFMKEMLTRTQNYCVIILKAGPNRNTDGADKVIWEHVRRNFSLRADGTMPIVCPINDGSPTHGVGIMDVTIDEARRLMDEDPGVKAGIFVYEVHPCRSFPGDRLPLRPAPDGGKTDK
jgi:hypothetical protein